MALTSKQRAYLKGLAASLDPIVQVGKDGLNDQIVRHFDESLETHELVKGTVMKTTAESPYELADEIARAVRADVVVTIGRRFVLYRHSRKLAEKGKSIILPR